MTVFLVASPPDQAPLETALPPQYAVESFPSRDALQNRLENHVGPAVVIFNADVPQIDPWVTAVQRVYPGAACIANLPPDQAKGLDTRQWPIADIMRAPADALAIAGRVATAYRLSQLQCSLHDSSQHDEVTQLYNRRHFV